VGDFKESIKEIINLYYPSRILIEPSGVAKLSDIIKSCKSLAKDKSITINNVFTVVDPMNYKVYLDNFGEFYKDQIKNAKTIILSKREDYEDGYVEKISSLIRDINKDSSIITVPLELIDAKDILKIAENDIEKYNEKSVVLKKSFGVYNVNKVHNSHNADNIFSNWGMETKKIFTKSKLEEVFGYIVKDKSCGNILRGKGIVQLENGKWTEFHYTPGKFQMNITTPQKVGKIVIIGEAVDKNRLEMLFGINR
jgi:G3E family GTPase